ncbi:MAG: phospholipid carrier-dependent glycosyltransferase [Woeseiaceae bacterium]|nr:phospholipid carrier-dependent glycosyltransferase [Woeseiaceae bacterium]
MSVRAKILFAVAYTLHVVWIFVLASVPPVSRDALTHHLAVPKLWLARGGIHELPEIPFSYYPQLLDVLYMLPLALGHDIAAKYLHFAFALLTALIIYLFVRRRTGNWWGALAGLMFLTLPAIVKLSVTVYVDLGLIFFSCAALFSTALWLEDTSKFKWLLIAGISSGLALSTKYNALVPFFVMSLLLPFFFLQSREHKNKEQIRTVRYGVIFVTLSLLVFSPWLARNFSLTGNPLYPLAQGVFETRVPQSSDSLDLASNAPSSKVKPLGPLLVRKLVYEESLPYTLMIPVRIFYEGEDDDPKYFDGRLNLLLLLLPLSLLLMGRNERGRFPEIRLFAVYSVLVFLVVFLIKDMRIRWIAPIIAPLVVLAAYALFLACEKLHDRMASRTVAHGFVGLMLVAYFVPNLLYTHDLHKKIDPLPFISGEISRDDYIQRHRPEYAAIQAANSLVPAGSRVLGLYLGSRRYYFSVDTTLSNRMFENLATNAHTADEIANGLSVRGFTYLVIRTDFFNRWLAESDMNTQARVQAFAGRNLQEVVNEEGYGLYKIIN